MSKRITAEERIISYFMSQPVELAQNMLLTAQSILRQRTGKTSERQQPRPDSRRPLGKRQNAAVEPPAGGPAQ